MTVREAVSAGARAFAAVPELAAHAGRDAQLLLLHQLSCSPTALRAYPEKELSPEEWKAYQTRLARRLRLEPVQYITGEQEFFGLTLRVNPAVLIPRPETEHLVEAVLEAMRKTPPRDRPRRILDVGTGSGAIAIALAIHMPWANLTAVDLSDDALAVARQNAATHQVGHRIRFLHSDLLRSVRIGPFDAIVGNPPYVPLADRTSLHSEVRDYEPAAALFAGDTGLDIYRRLIPEAWAGLEPGGLLALELGFGQQPSLAPLLASWHDVVFHNDLQGIPRVVLATKPL